MIKGFISPEDLRTCLLSAAESLSLNCRVINNLNVFPVPDGDTGTNMLSTFQAGIRGLNLAEKQDLPQMAAGMTAEMIRHSRGNSGFITARFFHGFFEPLSGAETLDAEHLSRGFTSGSFAVNSSLFSPVEGTMITVIRAMAEALKSGLGSASPGETHDPLRGTDIALVLGGALAAARVVLKQTPEFLPVLAKAGVVDSGALGFILLMEGFLGGMTGTPPVKEKESDYRFPAVKRAAADREAAETRVFGYCTEVSLTRIHDFSKEELSAFLKYRGNSIALVHEEGFLKVHIHTDTPQDIIQYLKKLGTVENVKIDNLIEEISRFTGGGNPDDQCAAAALIPGEGFREIYRSLGVEHCLLYTSHLPSAGEIQSFLEGIEAPNLVILPNNGNLLPAVITAAKKTDKHISVIHSGDIVQGLAAGYGYSADNTTEENTAAMKECLNMARGISIYKSGGSSEFDGLRINPDDYFALYRGAVTAVGTNLPGVALEALEAAGFESACNISFFYQDSAAMKGLDLLEARLADKNGDLEFEFLWGGQFREILIISVE